MSGTTRIAVTLLLCLPLLACWSRTGALIVGVALLVAGVRRLRQLHRAVLPSTMCPAGHAVDQYGRFRCGACGAVSEGWVWRCGICGRESGWTACTECGLATRRPGH